MSSRAQESMELSLESRQVTGIVVGALVALAMVFALGVGFGKRLAEAPMPTAAPATLTHLDSKPIAPAISDTGFTFQESLVKGDPNAVLAAAPAPVKKPAVTIAVAKPVTTPAPTVAIAVAAEKPTTPVAAPAPPLAHEDAALPPPPVPAIATEHPTTVKATASSNDEVKSGGYCVQFGASPARAEADKLAATLTTDGFHPYVVAADIPGKGRFFRVRVGHFSSRNDAEEVRVDAHSHRLNGLVMSAK